MPNDPAPVTVTHTTRDVLRVSGPDAIGFLQGQLSQDVAGLAVGSSAWSFVLQPQGKVDAWFRVHRTADDAGTIDVDTGWGPAVLARLERFKLRTKADIELVEAVPTVAVRGLQVDGGLAAGWPGIAGSDHVGADAVPPGLAAAELDAEGFEALRIAHGVPALGFELTDATIPAEAGQWVIDASVSFTKGCFTGQELVARIDSRGGNVPRHLCILRVAGPAPVAGVEVEVGGEVVGVVTSAATALDGAAVALAYVKRSVEVPTGGSVAGSVGGVNAAIERVPAV